MTEPDIALTLTTPASSTRDDIDAVRDALKDAGVPVTQELTQLRESAEIPPEVIWLMVGIGGYVLGALTKPTLDETGRRVQERIFGAQRAARAVLPPRIGLQVSVELAPNEQVLARYWLPNGAQRDEAERSLFDHYRTHPGGDVDRRWYRGVGWADDAQMRKRLESEEGS